MKRLSIASLVLAITSFTFAGCTSHARLAAPDGFADLRGGSFDDRVVAPDGVVVGVRSHANEVHGNLDFWTRVVSKNLEDQSYKAEPGKPRSVQAKNGVEGRQIRYTLEQGGRTEQYWLTLFVTEDRVFVVEAGGDAAYFNADVQPKVEAAIASIDLG